MKSCIEFLDLTENKISSISGIKDLVYLDTLLLAGNNLHSASFDGLSGLNVG